MTNLQFFESEFIELLPEILKAESLSSKLTLAIDDKSIHMFKTTIADTAKKIENDILQYVFTDLRSLLNLGFLALFFQDFLDSEQEFVYKEKITEPDFKSKLNRAICTRVRDQDSAGNQRAHAPSVHCLRVLENRRELLLGICQVRQSSHPQVHDLLCFNGLRRVQSPLKILRPTQKQGSQNHLLF